MDFEANEKANDPKKIRCSRSIQKKNRLHYDDDSSSSEDSEADENFESNGGLSLFTIRLVQ